MTLRTNMVEYAFTMNATTVSSATPTVTFPAREIYIAETSGRAFRSAILEVTCHDATSTIALSPTAWELALDLGGAGYSSGRVTDTITNSGEHQSYIFHRDFTSYFSSHFGGGTTQACTARFDLVGVPSGNHAAKLYITYEYSDSSGTERTKTVRIPIEGSTGPLTTAAGTLAANQCPILNTFLPESSKAFKDIFYDVWVNNGQLSSLAGNLIMEDGASSIAFAAHQATLLSGTFNHYIWNRASMDTSSGYNPQLKASVSSQFDSPAVVLIATYTYNSAETTRVLNSILIPYELPSMVKSTAATDASYTERNLMVQEPSGTGGISLAQSGVMYQFNANAPASGLEIAVGDQAYRKYTIRNSSICGGYALMQRIDSGSSLGAAFSLARGKNAISLKTYSSGVDTNTNVSGLYYINYYSGMSSQGPGSHNHTTFWHGKDFQADVTIHKTPTQVAPNIPETNYWLTSIGYRVPYITTAMVTGGMSLYGQVNAGEGSSLGWENIYSDVYLADAENGIGFIYCRGRDAFKRFPTDPDPSRLDPESARYYKLVCPDTLYAGIQLICTYHTQAYGASGAITEYEGDGSGIPVNVYRTDTNELISTAVSSAGGNWAITWYDNTIPLYAEARESSSRVGRSDNFLAA